MLQRGVLVFKFGLLSGNLLFEALDLLLNFVFVSVEHLLEDIGLNWVLPERQVNLNVAQIRSFKLVLWPWFLTLSGEEVQ